MLNMLIATFPMESTDKAVETFLDNMANDPFPDFVEMTALYSHWGDAGVKTYTIYDIKEGKVDEGIMEITRRMARFRSVKGYTIESEIILPLEAALSVIDKEMP